MAAILDPRSADVAVLDPGAATAPSGSTIAGDGVTADVVTGAGAADQVSVTPGPAPTGAADPTAVATVIESAPDVAALLRRLLIDRDVDREATIDEVVAVATRGLRPDAVAVSGALEQLWALGSGMLEQAFPASSVLLTADQVRDVLAPYADLAVAVSKSAASLLTQFAGLWPSADQLPTPFPTIAAGLEAFFVGMVGAATDEGLNSTGYWTQILTKLQTSMTEHCIIAVTVIEAGMVAGIVENLVGDLLGLCGLVLLLGSGPILVGLLAMAAYAAWEAGAAGVATELGAGLAHLAMSPFQTLHDAPAGVEFLFALGEILGPLALDLLLWATGLEMMTLVAGMMKSSQAASAIGTLRKLLPTTTPKALLDLIDKLGPELRATVRDALGALSSDGAALVDALEARPGGAGLVEDLADLVEELDGDADGLAKVLYAVRSLVAMSEEEFAAMLVINQHLPATGSFANFSLVELLADDEAGALAQELASLLAPVAGSVDPRDYGLGSVVNAFFGNDNQRTGARGALRVAAELLDEGPTLLRFEEVEVGRVVDISATQVASGADATGVYGLVLSVEVKAYPSGTLGAKSGSKLIRQMARDLLRALSAGDTGFERLRWYLDEDGHAALHTEFEALFIDALGAITGDVQKLGLNPADVERALDLALAEGRLLRTYQL